MIESKKDELGRAGIVVYYDQMVQMLSLPDEQLIEFIRAYFNNCLGTEVNCSNAACNALLQNYLLQSGEQGKRYERKKTHFPLEMFVPFFEKGSYSNVELAEIIGCSEGTVRQKRKYWAAEKEKNNNNKNNNKNNNNNNNNNGTITITRNYDEITNDNTKSSTLPTNKSDNFVKFGF